MNPTCAKITLTGEVRYMYFSWFCDPIAVEVCELSECFFFDWSGEILDEISAEEGCKILAAGWLAFILVS